MRSRRDPAEQGREAGSAEDQVQAVDGGRGPAARAERGRLALVGLGPGDESLLAPAARAALEAARAVVGYTGYLELVDPALLADKKVVATGMMGEVERVKSAVDLAAGGTDTAVVCSGDAGIYAMAGLTLEIMEADGCVDAVRFEVIPGVPAFTAAAALLGAPLMHDFASVSLSDLLTPWETIEKRLDLAAEADFVIAIYNPRSKRRAEHFARAMEIIGRHRAGRTPVGVVCKAYREGQTVRLTTLAEVNEDEVDMQTVVIVGNSSTRTACGQMLTPRGYHQKYDLS